MAVQQSIPRVNLGGRALLLGPAGDIELSDLTDLNASGRAVVVTGLPGQREEARRAGLELLSTHAAGSVVIELPVGPSEPPITAAWVAEVMSEGLLVGAVLSADDAGAEIGLLTQVLSAGVCLVRGADPVRFRRVRAVVEALALASSTGGSTSEAGGQP